MKTHDFKFELSESQPVSFKLNEKKLMIINE